MGLLNDHAMAITAAALMLMYLIRFVAKLVAVRRHFSKLPGPPHSPMFGHLVSMGKVVEKLPKRVHPHVFPQFLTTEYNLPPVFYLDLSPIAQPMMLVLEPDLAYDVAVNSGLLKNESLKDSIEPLAGRENLVGSDGQLWKRWRSIFNPGFSVQQLITQVSTIVDCTEEFITLLDEHANRNTVFRMEEEATKITIDVIGKVICDHDFKSLTQTSEFVGVMRKTLGWMPDHQSMNPFHWWNPLRPLFFKYYKRRMDAYIGKVLDERFSVRGVERQSKAMKKTAIDLALEEYFKETGKDVDSRIATMDSEFRRYAIDQLLILLFAGHDTTASTICYCYYLLSKRPEALDKIRAELNEVFGSGVNANEQIRQNPYIINRCEYTLAVIKEVLRLYPPASSIREGRKDYFIKDPVTGDMLPTEGCLVWPNVIALHRDARYWQDPHAFRPERFLPSNEKDNLPNAWKPFEKGPRNCIGQELALIEMKIILALTVREFDIESAYGELDKLNTDGTLWATEKSFKGGVQKCWDDEAYQVLLAAAKPREGMPCRVKRRSLK